MKCNSCWRTLDGRAIATTCGHIFCTDDASKLLTSDATCPMCEQLLSKSNMKAVELNPNDDWVNMVMAGTPPQGIMKSAFKGVMFWLGQKDVENQVTISKAVHIKQKYEEMQQKYMEKLEQVHGAYQKAMKKVQVLEQEKESLSKDKKELQEKYTEKSRQKRKLEEMYESLRGEYEQLKRGVHGQVPKDQLVMRRPAHFNNFTTANAFDDRKPRTPAEVREAFQPVTPEPGSDLWSAQASAGSGLFDMPGLPATRARNEVASPALAHRSQRSSAPGPSFKYSDPNPMFTPATGNTSNALRNLLLSPMRKPVASRLHSGLSG